MEIIFIINDAPHHVPALTKVPRKNEYVHYDKVMYTVYDVIYNLDVGEITIHLRKSW